MHKNKQGVTYCATPCLLLMWFYIVTSPPQKRLQLTINELAPDIAHMSQKKNSR